MDTVYSWLSTDGRGGFFAPPPAQSLAQSKIEGVINLNPILYDGKPVSALPRGGSSLDVIVGTSRIKNPS